MCIFVESEVGDLMERVFLNFDEVFFSIKYLILVFVLILDYLIVNMLFMIFLVDSIWWMVEVIFVILIVMVVLIEVLWFFFVWLFKLVGFFIFYCFNVLLNVGRKGILF